MVKRIWEILVLHFEIILDGVYVSFIVTSCHFVTWQEALACPRVYMCVCARARARAPYVCTNARAQVHASLFSLCVFFYIPTKANGIHLRNGTRTDDICSSARILSRSLSPCSATLRSSQGLHNYWPLSYCKLHVSV